MTDYTMADYLQGRNAPNLLMPYAPPPNRPRTHGKGSVQDIALPQTTQGNLLDRVARSFGQPSLDLTRRVEDEWRRTGQPPELGFTEQLGVLGMMPMGPFGAVRGSIRPPAGFEGPWYHGTVAPPFERFDLGRAGQNFNASAGVGFDPRAYFAPTHERARMFAELVARERGGDPRVIEAYLRNFTTDASRDAVVRNANDIWLPGDLGY